MAFLGPIETLRKFCAALNIDPDTQHVTRLVIDVPVDGVVQVTVHRLATVEQVDAVGGVLSTLTPDVVVSATEKTRADHPRP